ncbi:MAG: 30S ribosomal protein S6 [Candidatus Buchananbacteria bacterium RIFCSPHIGHO2_02_FULL_45_11b]|uniref:Small ribosomal subunit protein bS6 n=4 Tax=Candidatus Buchananiibacteriota TaxID=1817903 RepID=A0A1G1YLX2_9BACT|nr:MAG: 30S ribosomal protein S6 [Candidatus Buchananbacteria bacterium RIFCSPHIGHO2_01_FULL_46_12]OGY50811.1 MAG: 30S ribosomal protein S6 [Candidatus Buchananbacteria bacterium RIFCSPHIGHO2_02_FULL_45_11b]OGY53358.1 MAG: 30S ribosomal protein S6 [Candidatus Buchananbacteria bacterium RIFCSPLOWO2_01_FULL_45_31]OGY56951.1 MAG: 30S ribosomal protein S6 [Candidatus Buchananbacteria bacterium RIFCSPLOWO2_02_FULL_46_11b]
MTNHYELLYLVSAAYPEEDLAAIKEKVKDLIKKFEGQITFEDSFGKKKLAYPVKKAFHGYYLLYEFDLEGEKLKDLNNNLKLANEILRHIVVSKKPQSAQQRAEKKMAAKAVQIAETQVVEDKEKDKGKIKLEDLDQRLDEILGGDII